MSATGPPVALIAANAMFDATALGENSAKRYDREGLKFGRGTSHSLSLGGPRVKALRFATDSKIGKSNEP